MKCSRCEGVVGYGTEIVDFFSGAVRISSEAESVCINVHESFTQFAPKHLPGVMSVWTACSCLLLGNLSLNHNEVLTAEYGSSPYSCTEEKNTILQSSYFIVLIHTHSPCTE